jgi:hypothetical protein
MQQISPLFKCFLTSVTKAKTGAKYFEEVSVRHIIFYIFCETVTFENKWSKGKEMSTNEIKFNCPEYVFFQQISQILHFIWILLSLIVRWWIFSKNLSD